MMKITTALNEQFPLVKGEEKNHRYIFDDIIELTVTDKEQGFVGFRHLKNGKCYYNYTNQDAPNEYLYRDILSDYGFDTEKSIGNTTVQRNFPIRSTDHHRSHSEDVWT